MGKDTSFPLHLETNMSLRIFKPLYTHTLQHPGNTATPLIPAPGQLAHHGLVLAQLLGC
jgi:hypothetical protein